ncbi:Negative regulator of allantoin and glyoxylate utilization operons [Variovorax sp. PBL-H6]|nr:Negative regulator of allantoin and glyoxylate utilization operons [Variovorax sp. PBL-H6]
MHVLLLLAEAGRPLSVTQVANALQLPTSTAHRILKLLTSAQYATQDANSRYRTGPGFLRPTSTLLLLGRFYEAIERVQQQLVERSGESAFYAAYLSESGRLRFIASLQSHHAIGYVTRTDLDYSLLRGASGRAVASVLPETIVKAIYLRECTEDQDHTRLPDWASMLSSLASVRRNGYAVSESQRAQGAHAIAAPVFAAASNVVIGSVGVSMPAARRRPELTAKHIDLVRLAAADLTAAAVSSFSGTDVAMCN